MPLHKSTRGPRLDPTMISAPLGDFRHTMHIGRGGDAFGDTSFLSTHGPSQPSANQAPPTSVDPGLTHEAKLDSAPPSCLLRHSGSISSLNLDLDLDLGPSILGDVLGVMDGLGLDCVGDNVLNGKKSVAQVGLSEEASLVSIKNEINERAERCDKIDGPQETVLKLKGGGLRPKVRFSDKREEIVGQEVEAEDLEQDEGGSHCVSPDKGSVENGDGLAHDSQGRPEDEKLANHVADSPSSPASSLSSEYEGVSALDRREHLSQSESEEEEEEAGGEQGYTFEDEFDDEIGL